jgi:hypothetical protein
MEFPAILENLDMVFYGARLSRVVTTNDIPLPFSLCLKILKIKIVFLE